MKSFFNKKAQITIFVLLGLILIIGVFFFLRINTTEDDPEEDFLTQMRTGPILTNIERFSSRCVEEIIDESIKEVLIQGGRFNFTNIPHEEIGRYKIPYYENNQEIPTEQDLYESIRKMIIQNFEECVDDYQIFRELDVSITRQDTEVDLDSEDGLIIELDPRLTIRHEGATHTSRGIRQIYPYDVEALLKAMTQAINAQIQHPQGYVHITGIETTSNTHDLDFNIFGFNETTAMLIFSHEENYNASIFSLIHIGEIQDETI